MRIRIVAIAMLLLTAAVLLGQNGNDLYQQGLARESAGDIQGAIQIFERITRDFSSNRALTARALLQLGRWSDLLGQDQARKYYERVVRDYGDQAPIVDEARKRLQETTTKPLEINTPFTHDPWSFALSPDGKSLVFVATVDGKTSLWLRRLDSDKNAAIPGTESNHYAPGSTGANPFWSPDGKFIGYFEDQKLKKIPVGGGTPTTLADAPRNGGGAWNSTNDIVFAPDIFGPVYRVSANGGDAIALTTVIDPIGGHRYPKFLPDGRHFLVFAVPSNALASGFLVACSLDSSDCQQLTVGIGATAFFPPDRLVFVSGNSLQTQKLDMKKLELIGSQTFLADRVATWNGGASHIFAALSVSAAGPIAYRADVLPRRRLVWRDRVGRETGPLVPPILSDVTGVPRFSIDGKRVALVQGNQMLIVIAETGQYQIGRVGLGAMTSNTPVWLPDGDSFLFSAMQPISRGVSGAYDIWQLQRGRDPAERVRLVQTTENKIVADVNEGFVLFTSTSQTTRRDVLAASLEGNKEPIPVAATSAEEQNARFAPGGKWIAYQSDEVGGRNEVFLQSFPGAITARRRVSTGGGIMPEWSPDGRELYFLSPENRLMVASVTISADGTDVQVGKPVPLFASALPAGSTYAPAPDGQRFLISQPVEAAPPIFVLPNAFNGK